MTQLQTAPRVDTPIALQDTLVALIDLSLQAKQAHWNVVGPNFRPLHELLDEFTDAYRGWYDEVAERLTALRVAPDGRLATISATTPLPGLPEGQIDDRELVQLFEARVTSIADRARNYLAPVGEQDLVTQDLLIGIVAGLDKQAWMLRAQRA